MPAVGARRRRPALARPGGPGRGVVFATGRGTHAIAAQLGDGFTGVLQVDGYEAYKALVKRTKGGKIRLAFCLAHARRKFVAAHKRCARWCGRSCSM